MDPKEYLEQVEKKYPGPKDFVHLHNHTIFSPLDGVATPDEYFDLCVHHGMPAFAITDHGNLAGIPDGYFASQRTGAKFIVGCEVYFNDYHKKFIKLKEHGVTIGEIKAKNPELRDRIVRNRHLTVIAMDETGYSNLMSIMHIAWEKGFYYRPRIWFDEIAKHSDGLIVFSGCLNGPVCHELRHGNYEAGIKWIKKLRGVFGDRFYLEFQMPGEEVEGGKDAFKILAILSREMKIPGILSNDCHYATRKEFELQMVMMATSQRTTIDDPELFHVNSDEQFFKTRAELRKTFVDEGYTEYMTMKEFEILCDNTIKVADRCSVFEPDLSSKLPSFKDDSSVLQTAVVKALVAKGLHKDDRYVDRLKIELDRIVTKEFASYFLITKDLCDFSRSKDFMVGPARGSAGGSLVCYLLGIHSLDPIKFKLSFDRFLSESRGGNMLRVRMD